MKTFFSLFIVIALCCAFFACKHEGQRAAATESPRTKYAPPTVQLDMEVVEEAEMKAMNSAPPTPEPSGENYKHLEENSFSNTLQAPVSTFSIDADGASYANVRRFLEHGQLPPADAVRVEELLNYFRFDYPEPDGIHPLSFDGEITDCPWAEGRKLLRIGVKGEHIARRNLPPANFVFLVDVSGSMDEPNKLYLLKDAFAEFTKTLRPQDRVAIVTYSGSSEVALKSTPGNEQATILRAIEKLSPGGGTNGAGGIHGAYEVAMKNFLPEGNNRVILATDGDFNLGVSSEEELVQLIEKKRESGVFLTVLGVGEGNYQDAKMEQLANHGNGTFEYFDNLSEARKVLVEEFGEFYTVTKDVKIQLHFNPRLVKEYRLVGYENRLLDREDFTNDQKDAGEIGADQTITALYEITLVETRRTFNQKLASLDWLTGVTSGQPLNANAALRIDCRYKKPGNERSIPTSVELVAQSNDFEEASPNMRFAAAVAGYGLLLRNSEHKGDLTWKLVRKWAKGHPEFEALVEQAAELQSPGFLSLK